MSPCYVMPPAKDKRDDVALRAWIEECGFTPAVTYRLSTKDTYYDTYDGQLGIAEVRLYFRHGENLWYLEKNGKTKITQGGQVSGPKKGPLRKKLHRLTRKSELIPLLHVLREEQVFESKADPEKQIKTIHYRYQDPFVGEDTTLGPRLFMIQESEDIEHLLLSQLSGERKESFDPLLEGLALLNIVVPYQGRFSFEAAPSDPILLTLKKYLALQADVLTAHRRGGLLDLHVEFVHQLRVATRRGRTVTRTLAPHINDRRYQALARELKWLGNTLGHVRDFDVLLPVIRRDLNKVKGPQTSKDYLLSAFEKRRAASLKDAQASLGSERFDRLIQGLKEPERLFSGQKGRAKKTKRRALRASKPTRDLISPSVEGIYKGVKRLCDKPIKNLKTHDLHEVRIQFKKLRYMLEFFGPCLHPRARGLSKLTKGIQNELGHFNDACVALVYYESLAQALSSSRQDHTHDLLVLGALAERQYRKQEKYRRRFLKSWGNFDKTWLVSG